MIGRQRNTFGHAMGDIMLPAGESLTKRVRALVEQALKQNGYQINLSHEIDKIALRGISQATATLPPQH
jgi:hypothetical protein